jgi:hypothetical protein
MTAEISIKEGLQTTLFTEAEEFEDLKLKMLDRVVVLAIRSRVFRRMLYGDFAEAKKSIVELRYSGIVLGGIVQYICTDTADILKSETYDSKVVETIVALIDTVTYFGLPNLCKKAKGLLAVQWKRSHAFPVHF